MRPVHLIAGVALICFATAVQSGAAFSKPPVVLRICTADPPFQPFTRADGRGLLQVELARISTKLGVQVQDGMAPRERCLDNARNGATDAVFAAYAPERKSYLAFPMDGSDPNAAMSMAKARYLIYRRKGSGVRWNGKDFSGLKGQTVGVQRGFLLSLRLKHLAVGTDDGAMTAEQLIEKLVRGRNGQSVDAQEGSRTVGNFGEQCTD